MKEPLFNAALGAVVCALAVGLALTGRPHLASQLLLSQLCVSARTPGSPQLLFSPFP
jgi:hypothetical protein